MRLFAGKDTLLIGLWGPAAYHLLLRASCAAPGAPLLWAGYAFIPRYGRLRLPAHTAAPPGPTDVAFCRSQI